MTVSAILKEKGDEIFSLSPGQSLSEAAEMLAEKRVGALLVLDGDRMAGILSERDIVRALAAKGASVLESPVADTMTRKVRHCEPSDTVSRVMEIMTEGRFRHLPVMEGGDLVGFISIGDVVKRRIGEVQQEAESIREYVAAGG